MPGMQWDDQSQMDPQMLQHWQMFQRLMAARGPGGMQFGQDPGAGLTNQLAGGGQQGMMSPQMMAMLQYYLNQNSPQAQSQGSVTPVPGQYPGGGGGVDLGAMMQALGFPTR